MNIRNSIISIIKENLPESEVKVEILNGSNNYKIYIKSNIFNNKSKIEQHQIVYQFLEQFIGKEIHAVSINTIPTRT